MLTVKAAALRSGVCSSVIYGWISAGLLACYRLGRPGKRGSIRIEEADLQAFLTSRKQEGRWDNLPPVPEARPMKLRNLTLE